MKYFIVFLLAFTCFHSSAQSKNKIFKKAWIAKVYLVERIEKQGIFYSCEDSTITILSGKLHSDTLQIPVSTIYKLEMRKRNSVSRNILIGAMVGFGIGSAIGWSDYNSPGSATLDQVGHSLGAGLIGGFIGAFSGHLISSFISNNYMINGRTSEYNRIRNKLERYQFKVGQ